jgi:hypothetical protein
VGAVVIGFGALFICVATILNVATIFYGYQIPKADVADVLLAAGITWLWIGRK